MEFPNGDVTHKQAKLSFHVNCIIFCGVSPLLTPVVVSFHNL